MQKIFIEKPYRFVAPLMNDWLAKLMNNRLIHIPLLRFTDSIVSVESRGVERLKKSVDDGHAIMLVPNHPRTSDPIAMYDLLRRVNKPMFAMASWHLFNHGWHNKAIIRTYGGFSVNREGLDKTSINFAVSALQKNLRPLLMFPEGATSRTNDALMPFLDGPTFIARTAARRRAKEGLKTVIHPVAIRYLIDGDLETELNRILNPAEELLGCESNRQRKPVARVQLALEELVRHKEKEFDVEPATELDPFQRRQRLADVAMASAEIRCFGSASSESVTSRIRNIRATVFPELLNNSTLTEDQRSVRWKDLERSYLAWQMASYPQDYLAGTPSKERILDIAAKINEDLTDQPRRNGKQRVIIEACEPITVPAAKYRGETLDPLIEEIQQQLRQKMVELERETRVKT